LKTEGNYTPKIKKYSIKSMGYGKSGWTTYADLGVLPKIQWFLSTICAEEAADENHK
jgi:hypothetical protein